MHRTVDNMKKRQEDAIEAVNGPTTGNDTAIQKLAARSKEQTEKLNSLLESLSTKLEYVGDKMARDTHKPIIEAKNKQRIMALTEGLKFQQHKDKLDEEAAKL